MIYYLTSQNRMVVSGVELRVGETLVLQCVEGDTEWTPYQPDHRARVKIKKTSRQDLTGDDQSGTMFDVRKR